MVMSLTLLNPIRGSTCCGGGGSLPLSAAGRSQVGAPPSQARPRPQALAHLAHSVPVHLLPDVVLQRPLAGRGAPPPPCSEVGTATCTESHQG